MLENKILHLPLTSDPNRFISKAYKFDKFRCFKDKHNSPEIWAVKYDEQHFSLSLYEYFKIPFPIQLQGSVVSRLSSYLSGRIAVRYALENLGEPTTHISIGRNGEPAWPADITGSITHSESLAIAICTNKSKGILVGIDTEQLTTSNKLENLKNIISNPSEVNKIIEVLGWPSVGEAKLLIFSAKESLFKALHKYIQKYLDFDSLKLIDLDKESQIMKFIITKKLSESFKKNDKIYVKYLIDKNNLVTLVFDNSLQEY